MAGSPLAGFFTIAYNIAEGVIALYFGLSDEPRTRFEVSALRVTGTAFNLLAGGLGLSALYSLFSAHKPQTTLPGLILSVVSIGVIWILVWGKRRVGRELHSAPILADTNCTLVCIYMSLVLLGSRLIYELTGLGFIDCLGALGLIYFSIKEGRESFDKASGLECDCEDGTCRD